MDSFQRESSPTLSMREKTLLKRRINKEHNSNFYAGYVHINEEHLHKTGIRGRKQYIIYVLMAIMFITAVVNLLITLTIIGSLRIDKDGMRYLEFSPPGILLRFLEDSDMNEVDLMENIIHSIPYQGIEISSLRDQEVELKSSDSNSSVTFNQHKISIKSQDGFSIVAPETGKTIFSTDFSKFKFPEATNSVKAAEINTHRISSGVNSDLKLESDQDITIKGNEGLTALGKEIILSSEQDVDLLTKEHLILEGGGEGFYIPKLRCLARTSSGGSSAEASFKICVCIDRGTLFTVPAPLRCDQANENENPCLSE